MWNDMAAKFVFEVGQVVEHKADNIRMVVVSRIVDECHGGHQRHYCCSRVSRDNKVMQMFNEVELQAAVPFLASLESQLSEGWKLAKECESPSPKAPQSE